jgi:hypothetical protein
MGNVQRVDGSGSEGPRLGVELFRFAILSNSPKNSLLFGIGISSPLSVRCVGSPGRVSGLGFRGMLPPV